MSDEKRFGVRAVLDMRDVSDATGFSYQSLGHYIMEPEFEATFYEVVEHPDTDDVQRVAELPKQQDAILVSAHLNAMHSSLMMAQAEASIVTDIGKLSHNSIFVKAVQMRQMMKVMSLLNSSGEYSATRCVINSKIYKEAVNG